jgi:hypothetical protein
MRKSTNHLTKQLRCLGSDVKRLRRKVLAAQPFALCPFSATRFLLNNEGVSPWSIVQHSLLYV